MIFTVHYKTAFQEYVAANILSKKDHISLCVKENKSRSRVGHQAHGIILVLTITDDGYRIMMMGRNRCANRAL